MTVPSEPPSRRQRLKSSDRKVAIAHAAAELFAERGFHATGSRDLAKACGVSEALMFRYFPNKEELWKAALESCRRNAIADSLRRIPEQEPSTEALVALTRELAAEFIGSGTDERHQNRDTIHRMVLRSLAEDGEFARQQASDLAVRLSSYVIACLGAARNAGDLALEPQEDEWTMATLYRLSLFAIGVQRLPSPPAAEFPGTEAELIDNFVRFQLRGLGLRPEAIERSLR
jgi:AcrR family transcriptional regulator